VIVLLNMFVETMIYFVFVRVSELDAGFRQNAKVLLMKLRFWSLYNNNCLCGGGNLQWFSLFFLSVCLYTPYRV